MRTVILGLQLGWVAGGWQHRGCYADSRVGQQGKLDGIVGYQGVQGGTKRSWTKRTL